MIYVVFIFFLILVVECAIILNYITLSEEQPRWWWRVWSGAAAIGIYFFIVMSLYMMFDLRVEYLTTLVAYLAASMLASTLVALMVASLALICTFRFNLSIYSHVKLE